MVTRLGIWAHHDDLQTASPGTGAGETDAGVALLAGDDTPSFCKQYQTFLECPVKMFCFILPIFTKITCLLVKRKYEKYCLTNFLLT